MSAPLQAALLLSAPGIPLLLALLVALPSSRRWAMMLASFAPAPALALAGFGGGVPDIEVPWLLLGSVVGLDRFDLWFLFVSGLIWLFAGLYARSSIPRAPGGARFFSFFLLAMGGNFALIVAQDLVSFYTGFSLMGLSAYGLVVHHGNERVRFAGRVYLVMTLVSELALFTGFVWIARETGSLAPGHEQIAALGGVAIGALLLGFGIKGGLIGLHLWMPVAYSAAPVPASAVLSGAMSQAAVIGLIRYLPLGDLPPPAWGDWLVMAGIAGAFFAVAVGTTQRDARVVLAYSSISQTGLMLAGLGLALVAAEVTPALVAAVTLFALHHGLAKAALFLGVGVSRRAAPRQRRWVAAGLLLPALALAGLPATSGVLAKAMLKSGAAAAGTPGELFYAILPWSSLATTLLMGRFLWLAWPQPGGDERGAPPGLWIPWAMLLLAVAATVWSIPWAQVEGIWTGDALRAALLPIVPGALVVATVAWLSRRYRFRFPFSLPPGDILVPLATAVQSLLAAARRLGSDWLPARREYALSRLRQLLRG